MSYWCYTGIQAIIIAERQLFQALPSKAQYLYKKEKKTQELIFS